MSQLDDFLKMLDQQDFARASAKQKKKPGKKTPEEMLAEEIQKQTIRSQAKKAIAKPPTRQQRMEAEVKRLKTQDELNKLTGRSKEEGADAVDRLLKAMKDQRNLMYDKDGEPVFSGKMEEKTTLRGRRSIPIPGTDRVIPIPGMSREIEIDTPGFDPRGRKGSNFRIAQERMEELQKDLQTAQKAKEQGITMGEAKRNQDIQKKYEEFLKLFDRPGVDKRRSDYLARLSTQSFFRK
tara:strand:- start:120 stop:830 length:711 start_codon:yes stop_codon:yes gene_type:complete